MKAMLLAVIQRYFISRTTNRQT